MQPPAEYETTYYNQTRPAETAGPQQKQPLSNGAIQGVL